MPNSDVLDETKGDFVSMAVDGATQIPFKHVLFLFLIMLFVFSDFFITNILSCLSDAVYMGSTTTKGTLIQISIVLVFYVLIHMLINNKFI